MKIGTKSVLFGAHCFFLHPFFVAYSWYKLYGFPWHPLLWLAFFVHDLGYIGKPNMDGPEGETHPELGAAIMRLFDREPYRYEKNDTVPCGYRSGLGYFFGVVNEMEEVGWRFGQHNGDGETASMFLPRYQWQDFALFHSRYYSKKAGAQPSRLCFADKMAFCYTPRWLYLPMTRATGELAEYMRHNTVKPDNFGGNPAATDAKEWHANLCNFMCIWVDTHKDGAVDTWTSADRHARDASGVTQ